MSRIFLLVSLFVISLSAQSAQSVQDFGTSVRGYFANDKSGTINNPVTTTEGGKTLDGATTYQGNVTCSGSNAKSFLSTSFVTGSGHDITVQIRLDKDLDGTKETSYATPFEVSGVCTNGIIKCDMGTFSNCYYYRWNFNGTNFGLTQSLRSEMGGCFCVNSSCGSPSLVSPSSILETLGAGITGATASYNRNYVITKTANSGSMIEYWGQNATNCTQTNGSSLPSFNPTSDFSLAGVDSVTSSQLQDTNSPYSTFQGGVSNTSLQLAQNSCEIKNPVSLSETTIKTFTGYLFEWSRNLENKVSNPFFLPMTKGDIASHINLFAQECRAWGCTGSTWLTTYSYKTKFEVGYIVNGSGGQVVNAYNESPIRIDTTFHESDSGGYKPFSVWAKAVWEDIVTPQVSSIQSNTCTTYENNTTCQLKEEKICDEMGSNCLTTMTNFTPSSMTIQPFCRNVSTSTYGWVICQDKDQITYTNSGPVNTTGTISATPAYPTVKRVYQCKYAMDNNTSDIQNAYGSVKTVQNGSQFSFTAQQKNSDGSWNTTSNDGSINFQAPANAKYCEVVWKDSSTPTVYSDGTNKAQTVAGAASVKTEIRQCSGADYSVCPIDSSKGESTKHPCGSIDDFPEVLGSLQAVADAAKDMICSQD